MVYEVLVIPSFNNHLYSDGFRYILSTKGCVDAVLR